VNLDTTLITEKPKITPRLAEMKTVLAKSTDLPVNTINVKTTTNENTDNINHDLTITAHTVALIKKI